MQTRCRRPFSDTPPVHSPDTALHVGIGKQKAPFSYAGMVGNGTADAAGSAGDGRRNRWSPQAVYHHGPF